MSFVTLNEWEQHAPVAGSPLAGWFLPVDSRVQRLAKELSQQGMLQVLETKRGLQVEATSFVGRVQLGDLTVTVRPKLTGLPLLRLMSYAYGLRDLRLFDKSAYSLEMAPFQDLLIWQLVAEAKELLSRGVRRDYVRAEEALSVPRGRIDFAKLAKDGGVQTASLPCRYYPRTEDCLPNRILLAGLQLASRLACDLSLRAEVRKLSKLLDEKVQRVSLGPSLWSLWRRSRNRLTENYEASVRLIQLLWSSSSISYGEDERDLPLPGFLFDMNRFFQRLLTRFLEDNLEDVSVQSEHRLHGVLAYATGWNPQNRRDPAPRPDIALLQNGKVVALLDAKYRDIWETSLPRDMLYQLAIYSLSGHGHGRSVLLYATTSPDAKESRVEVRDPLSASRKATVLIRPVNLISLDAALAAEGTTGKSARQQLARKWVDV